MDIKKIEELYKDDPEFKSFQARILCSAEEFLDKEKENRNWQTLSLEDQMLQMAFLIYDLLKEGKSREQVLAEFVRFRDVKYSPELVDAVEAMYKKELF